MRIGKNELEIMKILNQSGSREKYGVLKEKFDPSCKSKYKKITLSRALRSLTEKNLLMVYAVIENWGSWEYHGAEFNEFGEMVPVMKKPYDGKMSSEPPVEMYIGLTRKGEKELQKRL